MIIAATTGIAETDMLALCTILEEMVSASKKLIVLLQDEKRHIIEGEVDRLLKLSSEKETVIQYLARLNQDRIAVLQLSDRNDPPPTLRDLIPLCPDIYQNRLRTAHLRLEALSAGINELNQMNGLLTDRVLRQIAGLLGVLGHLNTAGSTYAQSGTMQTLPTGGRTLGKG